MSDHAERIAEAAAGLFAPFRRPPRVTVAALADAVRAALRSVCGHCEGGGRIGTPVGGERVEWSNCPHCSDGAALPAGPPTIARLVPCPVCGAFDGGTPLIIQRADRGYRVACIAPGCGVMTGWAGTAEGAAYLWTQLEPPAAPAPVAPPEPLNPHPGHCGCPLCDPEPQGWEGATADEVDLLLQAATWTRIEPDPGDPNDNWWRVVVTLSPTGVSTWARGQARAVADRLERLIASALNRKEGEPGGDPAAKPFAYAVNLEPDPEWRLIFTSERPTMGGAWRMIPCYAQPPARQPILHLGDATAYAGPDPATEGERRASVAVETERQRGELDPEPAAWSYTGDAYHHGAITPFREVARKWREADGRRGRPMYFVPPRDLRVREDEFHVLRLLGNGQITASKARELIDAIRDSLEPELMAYEVDGGTPLPDAEGQHEGEHPEPNSDALSSVLADTLMALGSLHKAAPELWSGWHAQIFKRAQRVQEKYLRADEFEGEHPEPVAKVGPDDVEWVVNDNAELGVKIGDRFFFLYKGHSLEYETGKHDDGSPMRWRPVWKREFGEVCWPVKLNSLGEFDTSGDEWKPLPTPGTRSPAPRQEASGDGDEVHKAARWLVEHFATWLEEEVEFRRLTPRILKDDLDRLRAALDAAPANAEPIPPGLRDAANRLADEAGAAVLVMRGGDGYEAAADVLDEAVSEARCALDAAPPSTPRDKLFEDCNACGGGGCPLCQPDAAPPGEGVSEGEQPFRVVKHGGEFGTSWAVVSWTNEALKTRWLARDVAEEEAAQLNRLFAARPSAAPPPAMSEEVSQAAARAVVERLERDADETPSRALSDALLNAAAHLRAKFNLGANLAADIARDDAAPSALPVEPLSEEVRELMRAATEAAQWLWLYAQHKQMQAPHLRSKALAGGLDRALAALDRKAEGGGGEAQP